MRPRRGGALREDRAGMISEAKTRNTPTSWTDTVNRRGLTLGECYIVTSLSDQPVATEGS